MIKKLILINTIFCSLTLFSCGQDHVESENWLTKFKSASESTVVLNNESNLVPLKNLDQRKIAFVDLGFSHFMVFDSLLNKYDKTDFFNGNIYCANQEFNKLLDDLKYHNTVIVTLSDVSVFNTDVLDLLAKLQIKKNLIIALFGDAKSLTKLDNMNAPIIWSPLHTNESASFSAQLVFGGTETKAVLPQSYTEKYQAGAGTKIEKIRLKYTVPEEVGINIEDLKEIDAIATEAISKKATPGCVVLVAKDGKVIFNRAYGTHTYDSGAQKEQVSDIFDLASITKTSATTLEAMRLYENNKLNLDTAISTYLAQTKDTDKSTIKVRELLLHQAGLIPFIPFYANLKPQDFSRDSSETYNIKVADSFFMQKSYYKDVMWQQMLKSPIKTRGKYVYSDLSMYFMKEILETITQKPLENYVSENFYKPLGMYTTGFNPRYRFLKSQIVPTEQDAYFRKTLLWGYVHDQGAAMVGGVAGHAGLFSNASDLAILYQMLLNKGTYGGKTYFKPSTVSLFTAKQSDISRRGLGFDGWDAESKTGYPSKLASSKTFGHTGYTGTAVWVDPKENLVYIFLSNRVNPEVNNKLSSLDIRPRIQDAIYKAIQKSK
ncbi:serine hydrolase domain-containing protein [Pedobacter arcticus]|uniref:serine hydrolase domain-containing protein n=1 Tax=Pedobacter arcticus TaxID=752140 RepID=UPI0003057595|nr:serine hydrolase [Pedobacter arcticus]